MTLKKYLSLEEELLPDNNKAVFIIPFTIALTIRMIYHILGIPDFWGDSYHSVYISWATIENDWVYSDFKGREVVWLPFYRYLSTAFMYIFGKFDLVIPHFVNMILGSVTCGMVALYTSYNTNKRIGIFSGVVLALASWHIAYSHMNMPEILALLLLVLALYVLKAGQSYWLLLIGFAGVLTRNELTVLLGVFGIFLLIKRNWLAALYLFIGSIIGLGIWARWNYIKQGEFTWWIEARSMGSAWDRHWGIIQGGDYVNDWYIHLLIFLSVFPVAVVPLLYRRSFSHALKQKFLKEGSVAIVFILVAFHWLFYLFMQTEYFTAPNGRYWLYSLPLACSAFGTWVYHIQKDRHGRIIRVSLIAAVLMLLPMFFLFYQQKKVYAFSKDLGAEIGRVVQGDSRIWLDLTDVIYYSGINPARAWSSEVVLSREYYESTWEEKAVFLTRRFEYDHIDYVVASPVSYSRVLPVWPQMKERQYFEWHGYGFTPIFSKFDTNDQVVMKPFDGWMRFFGGINKESVLWRIDKLPNQ